MRRGMAWVGPLLMATASTASAQALRLRADALGQALAPTGVVSVQGKLRDAGPVRAEASIWGGGGELGSRADVLVARLSLRTEDRRLSLHLGRMVVGPGALRPVHLDGGHVVAKTAWGTKLEAYGGLAVAPEFGTRDYDWLVGCRVGQSLGPALFGLAYLHRRSGGRLDDHEVGADIGLQLGDDVMLTGRGAWDLQNPGFSEALGALEWRPTRGLRLELYGSHRSASRILPATSLFAVLGDVPARQLGARVRWRAAPRLDVVLDGGGRSFEDTIGEQGRLRVLLRLDDFGDGVIGFQLERMGGPAEVGFSGVRLTFRQRLAAAWQIASELELVRPDSRASSGAVGAPSRGRWWPWGLVALEFEPAAQWLVAAALEASATSRYEHAVDGLLRVGWRWAP